MKQLRGLTLGKAPGTDDFAGCCFRDLIDGDDARTKFDRFMQPEKENLSPNPQINLGFGAGTR